MITERPSRSSSRDRLIDAAAQLLQTRGYHAMGLKEVARTGSAPIGSLYHHFPGGKEQLAEEALRRSGTATGRALADAAAGASSVETVIGSVVALIRDGFIQSGFQNGCPISTAVLEAGGESASIHSVGTDVFRAWHDVFEDRFVELGLSGDDARTLSAALVCGVEGAMIVARAQQGRGEFDLVEAGLLRLGGLLAGAY